MKTYCSDNINDGDLLLRVILVLVLGLICDQSPEFVQVDGRHMVLVLPDVEVPHTKLKSNSKKFMNILGMIKRTCLGILQRITSRH